jgi:hypothetical protein
MEERPLGAPRPGAPGSPVGRGQWFSLMRATASSEADEPPSVHFSGIPGGYRTVQPG